MMTEKQARPDVSMLDTPLSTAELAEAAAMATPQFGGAAIIHVEG